MTWYADNLYFPATKRVVDALSQMPLLNTHLYVIREIDGYKWYRDECRHSLGEHGLACVRPICFGESPTEQEQEEIVDRRTWPDEEVLYWYELLELNSKESGLESKSWKNDFKRLPDEVSRYLQSLSTALESSVMYYSCFMWGGDLEEETAWVFSPGLAKYSTFNFSSEASLGLVDHHHNQPVGQHENVLQVGMHQLGIQLPTWYFALHTRGFPWGNYRYKLASGNQRKQQ